MLPTIGARSLCESACKITQSSSSHLLIKFEDSVVGTLAVFRNRESLTYELMRFLMSWKCLCVSMIIIAMRYSLWVIRWCGSLHGFDVDEERRVLRQDNGRFGAISAHTVPSECLGEICCKREASALRDCFECPACGCAHGAA